MSREEKIKNVLNENKGYMTTDDFLRLNICKPMIKKYIDMGLIRKVHHGLYIDNNLLEDDYYILQKEYPSVVFSHNTALYLLKLSSEFPVDIDITVVKDKKVRGSFKVHHVKKEFYDIGITTILSPFNNEIRIYDMERSLCDLLRSKETLEFKEKVIKHYLNRKDKDIEKLQQYSKVFHIEELVSKVVAK